MIALFLNVKAQIGTVLLALHVSACGFKGDPIGFAGAHLGFSAADSDFHKALCGF